MDYGNFRAAGLAQVGGYNQGNGSASMWQGQLGADVPNLFGGVLSVDAIGSFAKDGQNTSIFNGACAVLKSGPFAGQTGCTNAIPKFYSDDDLKATLSNNTGFMLAAKYKWGPWQAMGGWEYFRQANPSDDYPNGFKTIGGYNVPGNIPTPAGVAPLGAAKVTGTSIEDFDGTSARRRLTSPLIAVDAGGRAQIYIVLYSKYSFIDRHLLK